MRVLHIWDQGINYLLARYLERIGVEVDCIHRAEFDPFGMTPEKWKKHYVGNGRWESYVFGWDVLKKSLGYYDLVHVHSFDKCLPIVSKFHPTIMHYHGSDIRERWDAERKYWRHADRILVSTHNLLEGAPKGTEYLHNPIDVDLFKPVPGAELVGEALYIDYGAVDLALKISHPYKLIVVPKGIPYRDMPRLFSGFTHYVDIKRDLQGRLLANKPDDTGSMVGLQALACGLTVLTMNGERRGLPMVHRPDVVADRLKEIYEEVLG